MKSRTVIVFAVLLLALLMMLLLVSNRDKRLEKQKLMQSAQADFLKELRDKNPSIDSNYIDSTHIDNDTAFYFRKDSFIGKSVISIR